MFLGLKIDGLNHWKSKVSVLSLVVSRQGFTLTHTHILMDFQYQSSLIVTTAHKPLFFLFWRLGHHIYTEHLLWGGRIILRTLTGAGKSMWSQLNADKGTRSFNQWLAKYEGSKCEDLHFPSTLRNLLWWWEKEQLWEDNGQEHPYSHTLLLHDSKKIADCWEFMDGIGKRTVDNV